MKTIITIIFTLFATAIYAQTNSYQALLDSAKTLFKSDRNLTQEELYKFDYRQIASMLEKVVEINPNDTEARYFLGYTYGRMNSPDGQSMTNVDLDLLYKTSEQFEKIIELTPKYTGEIIALDPYSKLGAEWGSLAVAYWYRNDVDSAIWAFNEGKKRGGFSDFMLETHRKTLDNCSENAILIAAADIHFYSLLFLQIVENYRPDVAVVEINLLNTTWYPAFLSNNKIVSFDLPSEVLDTVDYAIWNDSVITINDFSWTVHPTYRYYNDTWLIRGDIILLSLLKANKFQRDVYFTTGFGENQIVSLDKYLLPLGTVSKLSISDRTLPSFEDYKKNFTELLRLVQVLNLNSTDEHRIFEYDIRGGIYDVIRNYLIAGDKKEAKELMKLLDTLANEKKYPFYGEYAKEYSDWLRKNM
ncbi:MAG: hypothetical protein FWC39_03470 [Bacteroidetes bacterium]|nr:hypothetical protein [Bacteroidota bacterium]